MNSLQQDFLHLIQQESYPCIGAKAAAKKRVIHFVMSSSLLNNENDTVILSELYKFIDSWQTSPELLQSLVIIFEEALDVTEAQFETLLWAKLQNLHRLDREAYKWDAEVSHEVTDPKFCFSLGGHSFFIVGMHANSSRPARQFKRPVFVFNLHEQFEKLRAEGNFTKMRNKIREQDCKFNGSINPMVEDFGSHSEAIQYSGRRVDFEHHCPFHYLENAHDWKIIEPKSAQAFILKKDELLVVKDIYGQQVADLFCFNPDDHSEYLSSGRTIDYNGKIYFSTNDVLYSNQSRPMLTIVKDEVGYHDFLFTPCNKDTFRILYNESFPGTGCHEHLKQAFEPFQVNSDFITTTFNIFMYVGMSSGGKVEVLPPRSRKNDQIIFKSHQDLLVGLTACSAGQSNNFQFKPIAFKIISSNDKVYPDKIS